jgi:hypothetical protein
LKTEKDETYRRLMEKDQREKEQEKKKAEIDKKMLEASRQKQMAVCEEELKKLAKQTGETPTNVLSKGVSGRNNHSNINTASNLIALFGALATSILREFI